jgi:hypothetical protein
MVRSIYAAALHWRTSRYITGPNTANGFRNAEQVIHRLGYEDRNWVCKLRSHSTYCVEPGIAIRRRRRAARGALSHRHPSGKLQRIELDLANIKLTL